MDLRDYLRLLRRGALTIVAAVLLSVFAAVGYLQVTPKVYQTTAAILVTPNNPRTIGDLQVGAEYAQSSATTIATLIGTAAVLGPTVDELRADGFGEGLSVNSLEGTVTASAEEKSAVVIVSATAPDAALAATIANAVATRATVEVPELVSTRPTASEPLLQLQVIQAARPPGAPITPNAQRAIVLFLAVGLALGLALTLLRQSLDSRLRRSEDVPGMTEVPLLATLARERGRRRTQIVVRDAPSSPSVEGYRVLRTNLGALTTTPRRSVLVVAASHDAFAVQVPVNLAWSLAQAGRRVLLVDLDLRHSSAAALFGLSDPAGAADVLTGDADFRDVIQTTSLTSLDIVPGGVAPQAPSDLLSGAILDTMVRRAEEDYDYVVIHAPALLSFTDAAVVARAVSQTVMVVRAGHTRVPDLTRAMGVLASVGVTPLGLVLTDAKVSVADNLGARDGRLPGQTTPGEGRSRAGGARSADGPSGASGHRSTGASS